MLQEAAQTPRSGTDGDTNDETKVESAGVYPAEPLVMESMEDIQLEEVGTKIEQKTDEDTADIHTRKRPRLDEGRCVINDSNSQGLGEYSADGVSSGVVALVKKVLYGYAKLSLSIIKHKDEYTKYRNYRLLCPQPIHSSTPLLYQCCGRINEHYFTENFFSLLLFRIPSHNS